MSTDLVQATGLTRTFESRLAVDELSLSVRAGEVLALLGPNGAGKTTTFRMMAGLLLPTRGSVRVAGERLDRDSADRVRRRVGLLTESPGLWERLTVRVNLTTYARLHGVSAPDDRVTEVMDATGIGARADDRAGALSKGLKQRVAIARALLHDPPVILLDEPTAGLDPESARTVRDLVRGLRAAGRAVLVSTHNLVEAEELADRIAIMNTRLIACDTPAALREQRGTRRVVIEVEGPAEPFRQVALSLNQRIVECVGSRLVVDVPPHGTPDLVAALVAADARVRLVAPHERSLEDAYLDLVRRHA